ncbi:hypothetical protein IT407_04510 [Candidatus Uhrbacteria bacterium]|nr:hypothetical protein [Candidatus Uhrbacteria bacterium]
MEKTWANHERYQSDDEGLQRSRVFLEKEGFDVLGLIKSQRRHHIFKTRSSEGELRFVKVAQDPGEYIFLENEVRANDFLRPLTEGLRLRIPNGEYLQRKDGAYADFEFVEGERLADEGELRRAFTDHELETLFQFLMAKRGLKEADVPEFFLKRAKSEFADAVMVQKLEYAYLAPAIGPVITNDQAESIKRVFIETGFRREFDHHDFVAWNMLRDTQGNLVLTDPEHARWGMKWYDIAYNFLQTHVLLNEPEQAKRQLAFFLKRFKEALPNEPIEQEIIHPLAYWSGACAFHATQKPELVPVVREVIQNVLSGDLEGLLG